MAAPSPTRRHVLTLSAICAVAYFVGLTAHGVAAWHEGQKSAAWSLMSTSERWAPKSKRQPRVSAWASRSASQAGPRSRRP